MTRSMSPNTPPNPHAAAARAAMQAHMAEVRGEPLDRPNADYCLTWPGTQRGVCCIAGQWRRNEAGDIEAWYSAAQLKESLAAMQAAGG